LRVFKHLKSDWFRYGFETLAIVVGILAAFALEGWRDMRKEKQEELEILVNLMNNLQHAKVQSSSMIDVELKVTEDLFTALNQHSKGDSLPREFYSDSIFYLILWNLEMEVPIINSYSDIKNTGKTGLISNKQIRQNFTSLEQGISNLRFQIDDRLRVQQLRTDEIAVKDLNFVRTISYRNSEISAENEVENDYYALLEDPNIRNLLAIKLNLCNGVIRYRRELDAEITSLIALLETEIENF